MAKKQNTLMILALIGAGVFLAPKLLKAGSGSAARESDGDDGDDGDSTSKVMPDAVIDIERTGQTVPQAIETARDIAQTVKDAAVIIKTPAGESNIAVSSGKKRGLFKNLLKRKKKKFSKSQIREMRRRAQQYCKSQPKKKRPACRRNAMATMQRGQDIATAAMQIVV